MVLFTITALIGKKVELVGVEYVSENDFVGVEFFLAFGVQFLFGFCINMSVSRLFFLGTGIEEKKAESRYHKAFDTSSEHIHPEICRKDKGGDPKMKCYLAKNAAKNKAAGTLQLAEYFL